MSYSTLLHNLGFERDPFAKTNADEEDLLENYFIEPPFFKTVYGDIREPESAVVYAPRGGGKTALKRRIEISSRSDAFLNVTYNSFPTTGLKLRDITLEYHLQNIVRILLIALLSEATSKGIDQLDKDDKHLLYLLCKQHLSQLSSLDLKHALSAVTNLSDKARELWNQFTGPISVGIAAIAAHWGFKGPEISKFEIDKGKAGTLEEQIRFLVRIVPSFGFFSTYVLVDKVDENPLTNGAAASLTFIRPLLSDLGVLETKSLAFKLFLWDQIENGAREFSRPDRIRTYTLKWTAAQLKAMLSKRLSAHSLGTVKSLGAVVDLSRTVDLDELIVSLSGGSPRNIVRICKSIFDQQSELDATSNVISERAVLAGIEVIAAGIAAETVPENTLRDLKKLKRADFTLTNVYADVFRISQGAATQKVQAWQDVGAVVKIGTRQEKRGNRPSNVYAIASPIVLKHIFSDTNALDFSSKKMRRCDCGQLVLRDWDNSLVQSCQACERKFTETDLGSLVASEAI